MNAVGWEEFHNDKVKFLKSISQNNPDKLRALIGLTNHIIRKAILPMLQRSARRVGTKEEASVFEEIFELIKEEKWGSCFSMMGRFVAMFAAGHDYIERFSTKGRDNQ